jgi:copper chaperone CopZ
MKTLKFKTSAKCEGCVQSLSGKLNEAISDGSWDFDVTVSPSILTVKTENLKKEDIISVVEMAGYRIAFIEEVTS